MVRETFRGGRKETCTNSIQSIIPVEIKIQKYTLSWTYVPKKDKHACLSGSKLFHKSALNEKADSPTSGLSDDDNTYTGIAKVAISSDK